MEESDEKYCPFFPVLIALKVILIIILIRGLSTLGVRVRVSGYMSIPLSNGGVEVLSLLYISGADFLLTILMIENNR